MLNLFAAFIQMITLFIFWDSLFYVKLIQSFQMIILIIHFSTWLWNIWELF